MNLEPTRLVCTVNSGIECLNCKDVFQYYSERKYEIINNLISNKNELLDIDNFCMWNIGAHKRKNIKDKINSNQPSSNKHFKCKNCKLLEYLLEVGGTFPIIFSCKGLSSAKITESINLGLNYEYDSVNNIIYLDTFTNGIILNWYLEQKGFKGIINNYYSFVCKNNGYIISENINSIPFDKIPDDKILSVLVQIFKILKILEKYEFSIHGGIKSLFIIDKHYNVLLNDISKCSIKIEQNGQKGPSGSLKEHEGQNRIAPYNVQAKDKMLMQIKKVKYEYIGGIKILYKIDNLRELLNNLSYNIDIKRSSINLYLIFYYLLTFKNILQFIYSYNETYNIWKKLWIPSDFKRLNFDIKDLEEFRLREDALDFVLKELNNI